MWRPEVDARSMVKMMAVLAIDDGSDGTASRPEVRSIVNGDHGRPTGNSESCQKA